VSPLSGVKPNPVHAGSLPRWITGEKTFSYKSKSHTYQSITRARSQVLLLTACQTAKWKNPIANPFSTLGELHQTIRSMRNTLGELGLRFDVDGNKCLIWGPANPSN